MSISPSWKVLSAHLVILTAMLVLSAWAWLVLPADASIPIHWDLRGHPNGWAGTVEATLVLPVVLVMSLVAQAVSHRLEPRRRNLMRSIASHRLIALASSLVLAVGHLAVLGTALGWPIAIDSLVLISVGLFVVVLGNLFGKLRSNHAAGIRNRWTLADDTVWGQTQRFTGRAMVVIGLAAVSSPWWCSTRFGICLLVAGLVVIAGASTLFSYLSWRRLGAARNR